MILQECGTEVDSVPVICFHPDLSINKTDVDDDTPLLCGTMIDSIQLLKYDDAKKKKEIEEKKKETEGGKIDKKGEKEKDTEGEKLNKKEEKKDKVPSKKSKLA